MRSNEKNVILKQFPTKYHVKMTLKLDKNAYDFSGAGDFRLYLLSPVPTTNQYHDVGLVSFNKGKLIPFDNDNQRILVNQGVNSLPDDIQLEYDITVYSVHVDFNSIGEIYPYDKTTDEYRKNTRDYGSIEINHPKIKEMGNSLRKTSKNDLEYARNAFQALQKALKWKTTGKYGNLTDIFNNRGGDCWALSTVYISLLRHHGIPARYVTGGSKNDKAEFSGHVWPEFYLERYGWIPVDVSMTSAVPYFGYFSGTLIGFYRGNDFLYTLDGVQRKTDEVQTWGREFRCGGRCPTGTYSYNARFDITTLKQSNIGDEYNSDGNRRRRAAALMQMVNAERRGRGLKEFTRSENLDSALKQYIIEKNVNGREPDIWKEMAKQHYATQGLYYRWNALFDADLNLEPYILKDVKDIKGLFDPAFTEIGIGYFYDQNKGLHNYMVALTIPKEPCAISAKDLGAAPGETLTYDCPAGCRGGSLWGTDTYTADSSICAAARHSGVIGDRGGRVRIKIVPGLESYSGSERNGVRSESWKAFEKSFTVEKD